MLSRNSNRGRTICRLGWGVVARGGLWGVWVGWRPVAGVAALPRVPISVRGLALHTHPCCLFS